MRVSGASGATTSAPSGWLAASSRTTTGSPQSPARPANAIEARTARQSPPAEAAPTLRLAAQLELVHQPERAAGGVHGVGDPREHATEHFDRRVARSERGRDLGDRAEMWIDESARAADGVSGSARPDGSGRIPKAGLG